MSVQDIVNEAKQTLENGSGEESFRDSISTVDEEGKRKWVYPKKPKGRYTRARNIVGLLLLALLFAGPFIRIGGEPLLQADILERRFVIFGQIFWPQDLWLFGLAMITGVIFITLFTVVYGRVFCGWVCPQTIFMELVFRKVEYWIEGDRGKQVKLNKKPWDDPEKLWKKSLKHAVFFFIAFLISNTFLGYIIGSEELIAVVTDSPAEHMGGFISLVVFSGVFYSVFAFMREQVCTTVCPYGRLQGVLLDDKSIVVAYDNVRGEKRGKWRKREDREAAGKGDCIDCHQCVDVCPTGIDIRNGTQLECVNCTACIDACDAIMDKIGKPRGLIRYASEEEIREGRKFKFTGRMKAYTVVLVALLALLSSFLINRSDVDVTVLRTPGVMYQKTDDGRYRNLYNYKIINKTNKSFPLELKVLDGDAEMKVVGNGNGIQLEAKGKAEGVLFLLKDKEDLDGLKMPVEIGVYRDGEVIDQVETTFMGPGK